MGKKLLALVLSVLMLVSLLPMSALATIVDSNVAAIDDTGYDTLDSAIAASDSSTIKLLKNIDGNFDIPAGKTITLDLAGKTITGSGTDGGTIDVKGTLTVIDTVGGGSVVSPGDYAFRMNTEKATAGSPSNGGTLTIGSVDNAAYNGFSIVSVEGAVISSNTNNYHVTINGGTLSASDNAVLNANGNNGNGKNSTWTINGGTFNGGITSDGYVACGIYAPDAATWTINGGAFTITGGCGILARAGAVIIPNTSTVSITTTGSAVGKVGDSRVVVPCAALVFDSASGYPNKTDSDKLTVAAGEFVSGVDAVQFVNETSDTNQRIEVSGGSYSSAPAVGFLANDFIPVEQADGTYAVARAANPGETNEYAVVDNGNGSYTIGNSAGSFVLNPADVTGLDNLTLGQAQQVAKKLHADGASFAGTPTYELVASSSKVDGKDNTFTVFPRLNVTLNGVTVPTTLDPAQLNSNAFPYSVRLAFTAADGTTIAAKHTSTGHPVQYHYGTVSGNQVRFMDIMNFSEFELAEAYVVSFDANNGTGAAMAPMNFFPGETKALTANTFTRDGYNFIGWSESNTATIQDVANGGDFTPTATTTLYAVWDPVKFTVRYAANNGGDQYEDVYVTYGDTALAMDVDPTGADSSKLYFTNSNYSFIGWSRDGSISGTVYNAGDNIKALYSEPSPVLLYALWAKDSYTITYYRDDPDVSGDLVYFVSDPITANTSTTIAGAPAGWPTDPDTYTFDGWNTKPMGESGGAAYAAGDPIASMSGDLILHAQWKQDGFKVNVTALDPAVGTLSADKTTAKKGEWVTLTRTLNDGYTFDSYEVVKKDDSYEIDAADWDASGNKFKMPEDEVTVTLKYSATEYNVTVADDIENGTVEVVPAKQNAGKTVTVTTAPVNENYTTDKVTYTVGSDTTPKDAAKVDDTHYTIVMPANDITVSATFTLGGNAAIINGTTKVDEAGFAAAFTSVMPNSTATPVTITVQLLDDIDLGAELATIPVNAAVNLDLNGHTLKAAADQRIVEVKGTLNIDDTSAAKNGALQGNGTLSGGNGGLIVVNYPSAGGGVLTLANGYLIGGDAGTKYGGAVYLSDNASFTMTGGSITGNKAENGAGVYMDGTSSKFTFSGGVIADNIASDKGGGIYVNSGSTLKITSSGTVSGTISGDKAVLGAGVYISNSGAATMDAGKIINNEATSDGGGVYVGKSFTMSGTAEISGNTAGLYGGGIFVMPTSGNAELDGGEIKNNTATSYGGGVMSFGIVTIDGTDITANTGEDGSGVYQSKGTLTLKSGAIKNNTGADHSGVFVDTDAAIVIGGAPEITDNAGGNLCLASAKKISVASSTGAADTIGITLADKVGTFTDGLNASNLAGTAMFFSDDAKYVVALDGNEAMLTATYKVTAVVDPAGKATATVQNVTTSSAAGDYAYAISTDTVKFVVSGLTGYHLVSVVTDPVRTLNVVSATEYEINPDADLTITATVAANTFPVEYNANGGEGTMPTTDVFTYGSASNKLTKNTFTKVGYAFQGWDANNDGTKDFDDEAVLTDAQLPTTDGETIALKAVWAPITYTVTFDKNGGEGSAMPAQTLTYDKAENLSANTYSKTGYELVGWAYTATADVDAYDFAPGASVLNLADTQDAVVALFAVWKPVDQTLYIDYNDGVTAKKTVQYPYDYVINLDTDANFDITFSGHTLQGWYEEPVTTSVYKNSYAMPLGPKTLVAVWAMDDYYTVTYVANNGKSESDVTETNIANGTSYTISDNPGFSAPADGMEFAYWIRQDTGAEFPKSSTVTVNGDITFIAQWTYVTHTVTFDPANGTTQSTQTVPHGSVATEPAKPTKANNDFVGWFTASDELWDFAYQVKSDVSLTAKYQPQLVTVTYYCNISPDAVFTTVSWPYGSFSHSLLPTEKPVNGDYTFTDWFKGPGESTAALTDEDYSGFLPGVEHNAYAHWSTGEYNVIVDGTTVKTNAAKASYNDTVTLTVHMADGQELDKLNIVNKTTGDYIVGNDIGSNAYTFTMPASDVQATATFKSIGYTITLNSAMKNGTVKVYKNGSLVADLASETFNAGDLVTLEPAADAGYEYVTDTLVANEIGVATPITLSSNAFNMPAHDVTVMASFAAENRNITLHITGKGTLVSYPVDKQLTGQPVELTATASDGYSLTGFYYIINGDTAHPYALSLGGTETITMPGYAIDVYATFTAQPYAVTVGTLPAGGHIYVGPTGTDITGTYATDEDVTLQVVLEDGFSAAEISLKDSSNNVFKTITTGAGTTKFTMPAYAVTVDATFTNIPYKVEVTVNGNKGTANVTADPKENVNVGTDVKLTVETGDMVLTKLTAAYATDRDTYFINMDAVASGDYTFPMPAVDVIVTATFEEAEAMNTTTGVYYTTLEEAFEKANDGKKIELLKNASIAKQITVKGEAVTLDLGSYTITADAGFTGDRMFEVAKDTGSALTFEGSGTVDASNVTGATYAAIVMDRGTFTMNGDVTLTGGNVTKHGGAVIVKGDPVATFNMNGGTITGDNGAENGGGVYVEKGGIFNVDGKVNITGNTADGVKNNVFLQYNGGTARITVGALDSAAEIGVTMGNAGEFTEGNGGTYYKNFTSDKDQYFVRQNAGKTQAILTLPKAITIDYAVEGDVVCTIDGKVVSAAVADDKVTVTITPKPGYALTDLSIKGASIEYFPANVTPTTLDKAGGDYTLTMPSEAVTIKATYTAIKYPVTVVTPITGGALTPSVTEATVGYKVTVDVTPKPGYKYVDGTLKYNTTYDVEFDTVVAGMYAFEMPAEAVELNAEFQLSDLYIYTVNADTSDSVAALLVKDKDGNAITTAKMGDKITIEPDTKNGYKLESITVVYGTADDAVPFTVTYSGTDNTFESAEFTMPSANVTVTANWTKITDVTATAGKLKAAAIRTITDYQYYGVVLPEDTTVNYIIQKSVDEGTSNRLNDITHYLEALREEGVSLIVYGAVAYAWDDSVGAWANGGTAIDLSGAGDTFQFAVDGVPVTFAATVQDYVVAYESGSTSAMYGNEVVAIVYSVCPDTAAVAKKFNTSKFGDYFTVDAASVHQFDVYRNNYKLTSDTSFIRLDNEVQLKLNYKPSSRDSQLLVGVYHDKQTKILDAKKTSNEGDYVTTWSDLFCPYIVANPRTVTVTFNNIVNGSEPIATFVPPTGVDPCYNTPYTFTVTVKDGYTLEKVMADGYEVALDTTVSTPNAFTITPERLHYNVTAVVTVPVTFKSHYTNPANDLPDIVYNVGYDAEYEIVPGTLFAPESSAYSFWKWTGAEASDSTEYIVGQNYTFKTPTTIYAQWNLTTKYQIKFDDNLDPWKSEFVRIDGNKVDDGYIIVNDVAYNQPINNSLTNFTRDNYKRVGWYTDPTQLDDDTFKIVEGEPLSSTTNSARIYGKTSAVPGQDGVLSLTLYAKWEPVYTANDSAKDVTFKNTDADPSTTAIDLDDGTYAIYYSDFLEAEYIDDTNHKDVTRRFVTVKADDPTTIVDPTTVLPAGLNLNELTGEIYGVPAEVVDAKEFIVVVVSDEGKFFSAPQVFAITIDKLAVEFDYKIKETNSDAYKTFGDANPNPGEKFRNSDYLTNIKVNGADVDGFVDGATTAVYAVLTDTTSVDLRFEYSPNVTAAYAGDPATAYSEGPTTYKATVPILREEGENVGYYKIYTIANDVVIKDAATTANFSVTAGGKFGELTGSDSGYQFKINPKSITATSVHYSIGADTFIYTAHPIEPVPTVTDTVLVDPVNITLEKAENASETGSKFLVEYGQNLNVKDNGKVTADGNWVKITGIGNYTDTILVPLVITPKDLGADDVYATADDVTYRGPTTLSEPAGTSIYVVYNDVYLVVSDTNPDADCKVLSTGTNVKGTNIFVTGNGKDTSDGNWVTIEAWANGNFMNTKKVLYNILPFGLTVDWDTTGYPRTYDHTNAAPTANNARVVFAGDPAVTVTGYSYYKVEGDASNPTLTPLTGAPSDAGTYRAYASHTSNPNYCITVNPYCEYTINPKPITDAMITLDRYSDYYNGTDVTPGFTVVDGAYTLLADTDYTFVWSDYCIAADTYTLTVTGKDNYTGSGTADFVVLPKPIKIQATTAAEKVYGDDDPDLTYLITSDVAMPAIVNGEAVGVTLTRVAGEDVGEYAIDAYVLTGDAKDNYVVSDFTEGKLTITPRSLSTATITYEPVSAYYTGEDVTVAVKVTVDGLVSVTNPEIFTADAAYITWTDTNTSAVVTAPKDASTYTAKVLGTGNFMDYAVTTDVFTVYPVAITITANNNSKTVGANDPTLTATVSGKPAKGVDPVYTVSRASGETAGTYTISVTPTAGKNPNYIITTKTGTFTINPNTTPSGGSSTGGGGFGGGGGSTTAGNVLILAKTEYGKVDINTPSVFSGKPNTAKEEYQTTKIDAKTIVKLVVTPDKYFKVDKVTYTTTLNATPVEMVKDSDGFYVFPNDKGMPGAVTTVTATFVPENANNNSIGKQIIAGFVKDYETCTGVNCPMNKFVDLRVDAWYHDGIHYCLDNGIMQGFGDEYFKPDETTTRAQVVTVLWNIAGHPIAESPISFDDVKRDDWFYQAIMWAAANGIVNGYGDGNFGPNDPITREQLAKILYGYGLFYELDVSDTSDLAGYTGVDEISDWAVPYVKWAVGAGICCGEDGNSKVLAPGGNATRAELATMILNFCVKVGSK